MNILGISPLDKDATASIVQDGRILYAAGEERFSRIKQHEGFPYKSIEKGLELTGLQANEIDEVVYPFLSWDREMEKIEECLKADPVLLHGLKTGEMRRLLKAADQYRPRRYGEVHGLKDPESALEKGAVKNLAYRILALNSTAARNASKFLLSRWAAASRKEHQAWQAALEKGLDEFGFRGKLKRYEHHVSHAANAYFNSGLERALVVTVDGYGTGLAGTINLAEGGKITRLASVRYPNSLGTFYEHVTASLGFNPSRHAGKVVGLAAYGDPDRLEEALFCWFKREPGEFFMHQAHNVFLSRHLATRFPMVDVAAAHQRVLERIVSEWVDYWINKTSADAVVLSGGVTANVKMNQRIFELPGVKRLFVYPNMGDGGCGTGLAVLRSIPGGAVNRMDTVYLGPDYDKREMSRALDEAGLQYEEPKELAREIAERIRDGQVVARFDGRMEYGPRALGNRSILYHAGEPSVNQWLNERLGRTEFMPFAPVTLYEQRARCFKDLEGAEHSAEFMTITFDCTSYMKRQCPAAVHVDGTARPQLIRRDSNPGYYDIVAEYERLTGIPSLINTSFNMHEEPIVCSPQDAVRAFVKGSLDVLVLGPYVVSKAKEGGSGSM